MSFKASLMFSLVIAAGAAACHSDKNTGSTAPSGGMTPGADPTLGAGSNGPATAGGASTQNSVYGGNTGSGSAPGDRFSNNNVDPATGIPADAGVGGDGGTSR